MNTNDQLSTVLNMANESMILAIGNLSETLRHYADAITIIVKRIGSMYSLIVECYLEQQQLKAVATPRQWHLYQNGSPRVHKKWRNALRRRARIAEKRKEGRNP